MSNQRPNLPGFSDPITIDDVNDDDVVEIGEFSNPDSGLAGQLRNIAYESVQDVDDDVVETISGGHAGSQRDKIAEQMQMELALRMSLPEKQENQHVRDDLAEIEQAELEAALRESEELANRNSRSEQEQIQQALRLSQRLPTSSRWWEETDGDATGSSASVHGGARQKTTTQRASQGPPSASAAQPRTDNAPSEAAARAEPPTGAAARARYLGAAAAAAGAGAGDSAEEDTVLVEVTVGDGVLVDIEKDFYKAKLNIEKVYKIENDWLWSKFRNEVELMRTHRDSEFVLNMQALYHGTDAPVEVISEEGLDDRLSSRGHFGKGIYFSDDPRKCLQYCEDGRDPYMLRCRVLLGESKVYPPGEKDLKLKREPVKGVVAGQKVYYDSVQGQPRDYTEYVVYERRRVLLEHVIFYSEKEPRRAAKPNAMTSAQNDPIPSSSSSNATASVIKPAATSQVITSAIDSDDEDIYTPIASNANTEPLRPNVRRATCELEDTGAKPKTQPALEMIDVDEPVTRERRSSVDEPARSERRSSVDGEERQRKRSVGDSDSDDDVDDRETRRNRRRSIDMEQSSPVVRQRRSSVVDSDEDEVRVHPIGAEDDNTEMSEVISAVMDDLVSDFLQVTALDYTDASTAIARRYIKKAINFDVQMAIQLYYDEMEG